ncbi:MAG TPA: hypothetical protein VHQ86_05035 [Candidatus Saccharimonadia bacterium]|nr:hypothetical protein [Candidatus Saccharimonadia bacterium]
MTRGMGQEVIRPGGNHATTFGRLIDLRAPLVPALAPRRPEPPPPPADVSAATAPIATAPPPAKYTFRTIGAWPWKLLLWRSLKLGLVIGLSYVLLSVNISLPERLIGIYAAVAWLYAINSQRTLLVALLFLASVAVYSVLGDSDTAQTNAIYAFYFLVIGFVSAALELRPRAPK